MPDKPETLSTNRARGGIGTHVVRYILIISTVLAIGAMLWVYAAAPVATSPAGPGPAGDTPVTRASPPQG